MGPEELGRSLPRHRVKAWGERPGSRSFDSACSRFCPPVARGWGKVLPRFSFLSLWEARVEGPSVPSSLTQALAG